MSRPQATASSEAPAAAYHNVDCDSYLAISRHFKFQVIFADA